MTTKEKFNSIDQSKLSKEAVSTLTKMKKASDDFKNEAVTKKVDAALDQLIKRLKKEKPEAIKTVKKPTAKKTASKSTGSKGTVMKLAKEIRKEGESWRDAVKRAGEQIKKGEKKAVSEVKSEMDKLKDLIENDEILRGFKNSDVSRDAKLKAKPKGKRKSTAGWKNQYGASKGGRTYYESRENRSDRYSPKYPKDKPFLASGGHLAQGDIQQLDIANADLFAKGGEIKTFKMTDDTYENIFLSRGFKPKRGSSGLKFFEHKPSGTFVTYDPRGIQTRIIVESSLNPEDSYTIYEGDSISDLKKALDKQGIVILFEPEVENEYAKGGETRSKRSINTDRARLSKEPWEQAYLPKRKGSYYAKGGDIEDEVQYGSWYVEIFEDENDEEIRNREVARLIREGYMSGFDPTWSLEITDIEGDIDEATEEEIARLVEEGYVSGEVFMYKDNYAKGGALENSTYIPKEKVISVRLKNGKQYENDYSQMEFLNGIYISDSVITKDFDKENQMSLFKKGGKLPKGSIYIKRRDIDYVEYGDFDEPERADGKNLVGGIWIDPIKQKRLIEEAKREGRLESGGHLAQGDLQQLDIANADLFAKGGKIDYDYKLVGSYQDSEGNLESVKEFFGPDEFDLALDTYKELKNNNYNVKLFDKNGLMYSSEQKEDFYSFAKGGFLGSHGLEEGDTIIRSEGGYQVVKDKMGNTVYVDLSNGYRDSDPPLPFEEGGEIDAFTLSTVRGNDETIIDSQDKKITFKKGGKTYDEDKDYFEHYDEIPPKILKLINYYNDNLDDIQNPQGLEKLKTKFEEKGWTFDYGLDLEPYNLRPLKKSSFECGGSLNSVVSDSTSNFANYYLENGGELNTAVDDSLSHFDNFYLMEGSGAGMFAKGGRLKSALNRDRKYYNQNESWERAYSKGKNRKGYGSFSKGGILSPIERYVLEIEGITGVRKTAVEKFISENNLSDEEVLHIVIGLGRKQLKASEFRSAAMGDFENTKSVLNFAKSKKAVMLEKGGETRKIVVVNENVKYTPSKYKAIYKDYDKDGTVNIDDAFPLKSEKNQKVEQVELKETFDKLLDVKSELDGIMKDAVKTLDEKAPKGADIYARTKTPYSIIKKLVEKRMLDPDKGLTDMIGTTIAVDNQAQLEDVRDQIDNGLLGKVLDRDDYYKTPKAGYRAYHYIVEYKGVPVEVQLKTKQQKKLHEISHEYYKKGTLNPAGLNQVSILIEKSDSGNANAKAKVKELFKSKTNLGKKIASKTFKKGGAIEDLRKPMRNIDVYADDMFEKGGKVSFSQKAKAIAKNFEGKRVEPKYQKEYGKTYDKKEAMEVGNKIAGAYKAKHESKMEKGGTTGKKRGNPNSVFSLAKKIRKQGETWQAAVQRAKKQLQNEK